MYDSASARDPPMCVCVVGGGCGVGGVGGGTCMETCEHVSVSGYTSILIYTHTESMSVCVCVCACVCVLNFMQSMLFFN